MKRLTALAIIGSAAAIVVSTTSCLPVRVGQIVPPQSVRIGWTEVPALQRITAGDRAAPPPSAIPYRLLVKIKASEIRRRFTRTSLGDLRLRALLGSAGFPRDFLLADATELSRDDGVARVRVDFEKPVRIDDLRRGIPSTGWRLSRSFEGTLHRGPTVTSAVLEVPSGSIRDLLGRPATYPELQANSALHQTFQDLGVRSIRRVFRMVERPERRGGVRVESISSMLAAAAKRFPVRAARGYTDVTLAGNMENWFLLRLKSGGDLARAFRELSSSPLVESVSYDHRVTYQQQADPLKEPEYLNLNQWALQSSAAWGIDVAPAWAVRTPAQGRVVVAVIGSGIKEDLDELAGRIWSKECRAGQTPAVDGCEIAGNGSDDDGNGYVDDITGVTTDDEAPGGGSPVVESDHETKMAGIIAAAINGDKIAGVAGLADVKLMNVSLGFGLGCAELGEAVMYATLEGADVANMALQTAATPLLWEAIQAAVTRKGGGLTLVASAGNANFRVVQDYLQSNAPVPAWLPGVISVGGTDQTGRRWVVSPAIGSNHGPGLALAAPASNVRTIGFTTLTQTTADLVQANGTSASASLVSGAAALLLSHYPTTRVERLRSWLRANATDVPDPEGTGANLAGDDIYTGAGVLNANRATTQGQPDPVVVDLFIENGGCRSVKAYVCNAVVGSPDLGIKVLGPVMRWELHYGETDNPSSWILMSIPSAVRTRSLDVPRRVPEDVHYIDVADGYEYLNTDPLPNRRAYTMRLRAFDAQNREYVAYDWFMPVRAMIMWPAPNTPVPLAWGWPEINGLVDRRPGASYRVSVTGPGGTNPPQWQVGPATLEVVRAGYQKEAWDVAAGALVVPEPVYHSGTSRNFPQFAAPPVEEGSHRITLTVTSPGGTTTVDTQDMYVDASAFPGRPGWPVDTLAREFEWPRLLPRGILATAVDGAGSRRLFVQHDRHLLSLRPDGTTAWDFASLFQGWDINAEAFRDPPGFVVRDLDGDGQKEVVATGTIAADRWLSAVAVLRSDGTPYNSKWPLTWPRTWDWAPPGKVRTLDIDGNGSIEIAYFERLSADPQASGRLSVVDLQGSPLPGYPVDIGAHSMAIHAGDLDANGSDELLLENGTVYTAGGAQWAGWSPAVTPLLSSKIVQIDSTAPREVLTYGLALDRRYRVDLANANGTRYAGAWPAVLDLLVERRYLHDSTYSWMFATTAQLIAGGPSEIVVCYDKIVVLNADGTRAATIPEITLNGQCGGIDAVDVDGDGQLELVAVVTKFEEDQGWHVPAYADLHAFELTGAPLAARDSRWPIRGGLSAVGTDHVALGMNMAIQDIDGDGNPEAIVVTPNHPYFASERYGKRHARIEVFNLR